MNLGENKNIVEITTAEISPNGFIVQGIQATQIGQVMQIVATILAFFCNMRGFFISVIDEQEQNESTESPVFMNLFTQIAEGANFTLSSELTGHMKEGHTNATATEKLLEFKDYLKTRKPGDRGDKAEKTVNSYFHDAKCVLNEIAKTHFEGVDLRELDLSNITSNYSTSTLH